MGSQSRRNSPDLIVSTQNTVASNQLSHTGLWLGSVLSGSARPSILTELETKQNFMFPPLLSRTVINPVFYFFLFSIFYLYKSNSLNLNVGLYICSCEITLCFMPLVSAHLDHFESNLSIHYIYSALCFR